MTDFSKQKCVACEGGIPPLSAKEVKLNLTFVKGWKSLNDLEIVKEFMFKDFKSGLVFVNKVGELAEKEGHHPNVFLMYGKVRITLMTHAVKGLSVNDFVLAAKIDKIK